MKYSFLLVSLIISTVVHADIYEVIDANGRKTYTDVPPVNSVNAKSVKASPQSGNSWGQSPSQDQNDEYFDELKRQQDAEEAEKESAAIREDERQKNAAQTLSDAEAALVQARSVQAGDLLPNKTKGMHYTQDYLERVRNAEQALERARLESQ